MQPWYLAYIIIYDIQTGEKYRFLADRWLAIDRDEFTSEIQVQIQEYHFTENTLLKSVFLLFKFLIIKSFRFFPESLPLKGL